MPAERPVCPKCQSDLLLARAVPGPFDKLARIFLLFAKPESRFAKYALGLYFITFECPACEFVYKAKLARTDPMAAGVKDGWLQGELKRPD